MIILTILMIKQEQKIQLILKTQNYKNLKIFVKFRIFAVVNKVSNKKN